MFSMVSSLSLFLILFALRSPQLLAHQDRLQVEFAHQAKCWRRERVEMRSAYLANRTQRDGGACSPEEKTGDQTPQPLAWDQARPTNVGSKHEDDQRKSDKDEQCCPDQFGEKKRPGDMKAV